MITASYLFAPEKYISGRHNCYYCGLPCDDTYTKKEYLKATFTNRDIVKYPCSEYVCGCCVESLFGSGNVTLLDGDYKTGRGASPRYYSWLLDGKNNKAFTKRHLEFARETIENPPEPPFSIIFADSGQKQLIFRAPVNYDKNIYRVLLEDKEIEVNVSLYKQYLELATVCSAAIGKMALKDPEQLYNFKNIIEYYGSEKPLEEWIKIYSTPLGELAAWLCAGKKEAQENECVISRRVSEETCGSSGSIKTVAGDGRDNNQGGGDQILLDFT